MGRDPNRFVDDDDIGVLVDNLQTFDPLGRLGGHRLGQCHFQHGTFGWPGGLDRNSTINAHQTCISEFGGRRARQPQHPCHHDVESFARQGFRDR